MKYKVILDDIVYCVDVRDEAVKCTAIEGEKAKAVKMDENDGQNDEELPDYFFNDDNESESIFSPMQGKIIAINTAVGKRVREGDVLAVLESMKMEISVLAKNEGDISQILVSVDDIVASNQELFVLKNTVNPSCEG